MPINVLTLSFVFSMLVVLQAVSISLHLQQFQDVPGASFFAKGNIILALASLLIMLRYWFYAEHSLIILSNVTLLAGVTLLYAAILRFVGKRENMSVLVATIAVFLLLFCYFTFVNDQINIRILIYSCALCVFCGMSANALYDYQRCMQSNAGKLMSVFLLVACGYSVVRGLYAFIMRPLQTLFDASILQASTFAVSIAGAMIWTFLIILLFNERSTLKKNESQKRMRTIYNAIPEMVCLTQLETGIIVDGNDRFFRRLGWNMEEATGLRTSDVGIWNGDANRDDYVALVKSNGYVDNMELLVKVRDGTCFTGLLSSSPVELGGVPHIINVIRDIDERKRLMNELELQARTDMLTGIANRRFFLDSIQREILRSKISGSISVFMMFDIDRFKDINDNYGHQIGDVVIQKVAEASKSVLRASDLLGRIGGDEFGVILTNIDPRSAEIIAEKIRRKIELLEAYIDEETTLHISISVGIAALRFGDDTVEELIARADRALYQAKEEGRNRVVTFW